MRLRSLLLYYTFFITARETRDWKEIYFDRSSRFAGARRSEAGLLVRVDHEFFRDRSIRHAGRERGEFGPRSPEPWPLPVSSGSQRKNGCRRFCAIVLRCDIERR